MALTTLAELMNTLPQQGTLHWIGLRPARREALLTPRDCMASTSEGLVGDRYAGRSGQRQVTLLQREHLEVIGSLLGGTTVDPASLRRNLVVSGVNLLALKGRTFGIGAAVLEHTGACHPCSFMEAQLGPGGYNAIRGHGGITARVIRDGLMKIGDPVFALSGG